MIRSSSASFLRRLALLALLPGGLLASVQPALAQDATHSVPTLEAMERQLALYQDAKAEDTQKTRLKDLYVAAVQSLRDAAENREDRARFDRLQAEAPAKVARFTTELQALQRGVRSASKASRNLGVGRLGRLLGEQREALAALRNEETALARRLATLQARIEPARTELKQLATQEEADLAPQPLAGESPQLSRARLDEWRARHEYHASLRERLESEVRTLPERIAAVQAELKLVVARREQAERFVAELQGLERLKRIEEATRQREEVRSRIATVPATVPEAARLAGEVGTLADEHVGLVSRIEGLSDEVDVASEALVALRSAHEGLRQQLAIAALSDALGPVLLEHYRQLSAFERPDAKLRELAVQLSEMRLRQFQVDQLLDAEPESRERSYAAVEASGTGSEDTTAHREALAMIDSLLADRINLLEALGREYGEATRHVVELDEVYQEQASVAAEFRTLVDRHLVWMKSHPPLGPGVLLHWPALTLGLVAAQDWRGFATETLASILQHPFSALAAVLVLLLVLRYDSRLRERLAALGLRKVGWHGYRYRMALESLGIHLLLALPVPLLLWWAGWLMGGMAEDNPLAGALGFAARSVGVLGYGYLFVLEVLGPEGFARQHLRWKTAPVQRLERVLRHALWALLPLTFLTSALRALPSPTPEESASRVAGMLLAIALFACSLLALRGGRGMYNAAFYSRSYPASGRIAAGIVVALVLAQPFSVVLDAMGYSFTGTALLVRVFFSIVVLLVAKLVLDTGLIGLAIAGQRSRAALAEQPVAPAEAMPADEPATGTVVGETGEEIDLEKMSASAIALLHVAVIGAVAVVLVLLWSQFFAALSILDEVGLWGYAATVDGKEVSATVSVLDLLGALLVLVLGFVLAKGLPALLGIVLIGFVTRKGLLFAIQTVISYVVGTIGVVAALQMLGFGWSKLQWMAAGLSVGLGFGLQEIFANFFAGLIMLFERPVRIGDVVTLGEYSGTIKNIRMRSTMLTDFDNREIIVPNKMFVTERLINWTLTSGVVRMSFDVGVSYSADPRLVHEILLRILAEDPRVLKDPAPSVIFREFGPSSLNFRCFAHVEDISVRFLVQNDLHMRIIEVFREKGIEIAYPQMDLHVRTVDAAARDAFGGEAR